MTDTASAVSHLNYSVDEVAEALRISPRMVRVLIARKDLQAHHIGRRVLVSDEALRRFIAAREAAEASA